MPKSNFPRVMSAVGGKAECPQWIKECPKIELHCHFDGSFSPDLLKECAQTHMATYSEELQGKLRAALADDESWKNVFSRDFCDKEQHSGEEFVSAHE